MKYRYYVALATPENGRGPANQAIEATTGNPADLQSFRQRALTNDGEVWCWCSLSMRQQNFDRLPDLQAQIGGKFGLIREVVDGAIVRHTTVAEWLESIGLHTVPININTSPTDALTALPGIGPSTAQAIVDERPFDDVDDLTRVSGIGPSTVDEIREHITVGDLI